MVTPVAFSPAGPGDRLVGRAAQPLFELGRSIAAEDQMGMAVDQAGRDPAPVEPLRPAGRDSRQVRPMSDPDDASVRRRHSGVLDHPMAPLAFGQGCGVAVGQKQVDLHRLGSPPRPPERAEEKSATRS